MKLSTRSRYGTRLMIELATHYDEKKKPVQLKDIASKQDISEKYLGQIIIPLKSAGLILSERGAHGGYLLAKPPAEITVKDIVICLEGDLSPVECLTTRERCTKANECVSKIVWHKLEDTIIDVLESVTLQDFLNEITNAEQTYNYVI